MSAAFEHVVSLVSMGDCITCGVPIAAPVAFKTQRLRDHEQFHCVNGHSQVYTGETEEQKLKKRLEWKEAELSRERERRETAERARAIAHGKLKAQSERVKNGVCPCCKRSFQNLRRHMAKKHPAFAGEETSSSGKETSS